jgi:hypothetical protein
MLIFLSFPHNSCVMCLPDVVSSFCLILSAPLQLSCPCNHGFFYPTTLIPYSKCQLLPFHNSVTIFERFCGRLCGLPGFLHSLPLHSFSFSPFLYQEKATMHALAFHFNRFWHYKKQLNETAMGDVRPREDVTRPLVIRRQRCEW